MYKLMLSNKPNKRFMVINPKGKLIYFGHPDYIVYWEHKDKKRMQQYLKRHKKNEIWSKRGINTAGWWSRWLNWNKPTLTSSINHIKKKFNIKIMII